MFVVAFSFAMDCVAMACSVRKKQGIKRRKIGKYKTFFRLSQKKTDRCGYLLFFFKKTLYI